MVCAYCNRERPLPYGDTCSEVCAEELGAREFAKDFWARRRLEREQEAREAAEHVHVKGGFCCSPEEGGTANVRNATHRWPK